MSCRRCTCRGVKGAWAFSNSSWVLFALSDLCAENFVEQGPISRLWNLRAGFGSKCSGFHVLIDDRELGVIHLRRVCSGFRRAGPSLSSVAPSEGGDSAQFWQSFIKGWSFLGFGVCVGPLRVQAPYSVGMRYKTVGNSERRGEGKQYRGRGEISSRVISLGSCVCVCVLRRSLGNCVCVCSPRIFDCVSFGPGPQGVSEER